MKKGDTCDTCKKHLIGGETVYISEDTEVTCQDCAEMLDARGQLNEELTNE